MSILLYLYYYSTILKYVSHFMGGLEAVVCPAHGDVVLADQIIGPVLTLCALCCLLNSSVVSVVRRTI